ncbi:MULTISPECIES: hypothetical protein [unclassified Marinobacter]|uniref:hypothetical protein n=1 Tax=unclassified Marinobacter TaxID=83889 RepID=UPI0026E18FEA|nr:MULTISPECIES: hypothetical protein [unclassified Marinobacter]MDO6440696.1 hypothetical protein [Marinobacter sp. 2_MG-2023]
MNDSLNAVIFRRDLSFVYGLTNSSQKPERQKYTDTIQEFERRTPNHYRARRKKCFRSAREYPLKKRRTGTGMIATVRKTAGRYREDSLPCKAGPSSLRIRRETQALV